MSPQPLHPSNPLRCPSAGPAMLELDASKELAQLGPLSTPPQTSQEWDKLTVSAAYSQQDNPGSQQIGVAIQPRPQSWEFCQLDSKGQNLGMTLASKDPSFSPGLTHLSYQSPVLLPAQATAQARPHCP